MKKQTRFFIKASASWKDSSRRKSGYFSYSDQSVKDCLITIDGDLATIVGNANAYGLTIFSKKVSGKYFSYNGKEVTEKTFKKYKVALIDKVNEMIKQRQHREKDASELAAYRLKDATEKIKSLLNPEKVAEWSKIGANEGNSHTRRTRWSNRAERMGFDRSHGGLLRDIVSELSKVSGEFWVNGKYNPAHL